LTHIYQWGQHLLAQYNDFLDLSRIETGILELEFKKVSIRNLIESMVLDLQQVSPGSFYSWYKAIHLEAESPENLPQIWLDPNRIRHILFESIRIFLISGMWAKIDIERLKLSLDYDGHLIKVKIFSPDKVRINQEFITELIGFETDMPVNKFVIYNMGIFIAYGLVKLHNGSMILKNEDDVGGIVTITLPIHQPELIDKNESYLA